MDRSFRKRRAVLTVASLAAACLVAGRAFAQPTFPRRPFNLLVPYPPGGLYDLIARSVDKPLSRELGQPVIIENLGAFGGALAAQKVLTLPSDGTMLFQGSPAELILAPIASSELRYKAEDFRPVQMIGSSPIAIYVRKGLPAGTTDELVALAKKADAEGKPLTYASIGVGSLYHLIGEHFAQTIGARMKHVPYKGGGEIIKEIAAEKVDVAFLAVRLQLVEMAGQGQVKLIATLAPAQQSESLLLKQAPSVNDSKQFRDFAFKYWTGYFVKKDTPEPAVQELNRVLGVVIGDAHVRTQLERQGMLVARPQSLGQAQKEYEEQTALFRAIAKSVRFNTP